MNKKQKCGEVVPFPTFGGGPMYDEATARKMLEEAVLVPAHSARGGEAVIGFDPDDEALDNVYEIWGVGVEITPMIHFARKGDAKMCRYLASRGASTTKASGCGESFPMYVAAWRGHLDVCKFLYANGVKIDIRRMNIDGWTPLNRAAIQDEHEIVRWLVLKGALCANDSSEEIDGDRFYRHNRSKSNYLFANELLSTRERLVDWAEEVTRTHASIIMFLQGTLPPAPEMDRRCNLQCFSGHPGIRKHICSFVGQEVTKKKHLNILRQIKGALP